MKGRTLTLLFASLVIPALAATTPAPTSITARETPCNAMAESTIRNAASLQYVAKLGHGSFVECKNAQCEIALNGLQIPPSISLSVITHADRFIIAAVCRQSIDPEVAIFDSGAGIMK